tara:strand:+ start:9165 stop:9941 length:777 start_codon:yes stop_codon:yes gene_type:complete
LPEFALKRNSSLSRRSKKKIFHKLNLKTSIIENDDVIFHVTDGNLIEYNFANHISNHKKQLKILHQALPNLLFQREFFILHGSAFEFKDRSIILMGTSGSGKSESLNVIKNHNRVISDDIIALKFSENKTICYPGLSVLCIRNNNSERPLEDRRNRALEILADNVMVQNKLNVTDIFYLNWGSENNIYKIDGIKSVKQIILNSFRPIPTGDCKKSEKFYLSSISSLVKDTDQYIFERKEGSVQHSILKLYEFLENKYD